MKAKVFFMMVCCCVIVGIGIWVLPGSIKNGNLIMSEIKTNFRHSVFLDYYPESDTIKEVEIGGAINMTDCDLKKNGNSIYNQKQHIEQITDYLNTIALVSSAKEELPNKSPDSYIQYFDNNGILTGNFLIYGQAFIEDAINDKVYQVKRNKASIIQELEKMDFN